MWCDVTVTKGIRIRNTSSNSSSSVLLFLLLLSLLASCANGLTVLSYKSGRVIRSAQQLSPGVEQLLNACRVPQSPAARKAVEACISRLEGQAEQKGNAQLRQKVKLGAAYRTIWSTVTSDTIPGIVLRQLPDCILGGRSWQCISSDGKAAENIVYWRFGSLLSLRMAGLAALAPLSGESAGRNGYDLIIKGLEFRWGPGGWLPEAYPQRIPVATNKVLKVFNLAEGQELENGKGTLEVVYNDGSLRISRDNVQKNTYVHLLEPLENSQFAIAYPEVL